MNIHGDHSYWKQGALGAAGVRRVWAGAGPQGAAYRGGAYCAASRTACLINAADVRRFMVACSLV